MNKKLLTGLLAAVSVVSLVACGGNSSSEQPSSEPVSSEVSSEDKNDKVLEDTTHHSWVIQGDNEIKDPETGEWINNAWHGGAGKTNEQYQKSALSATSINAVKAIDAKLGEALESKNVQYLYMGEVRLGVRKSGWTFKAIKEDGKIYVRDGSFAVKVCPVDYEEEDEVYAEDGWIPNAHTHHVESLTPSTVWYPAWQEAADENGFSWANDGGCVGQAGVYTIVVAKYKELSAADVPGYGVALVLKEAGTAATEDVEYVPPVENSFGVVGTINNWGGTADTVLVKVGAGKFEATVELAAGAEIKVRANNAWSGDAGFAALEANENFEDKGGNIGCKVAGTYKITLEVTETPSETAGVAPTIDWKTAKITITAAA